MTGVTAEELHSKSFYATRMDLHKGGKIVSTRNMIRIVVNGDCMKPRNIVEGTQLYVEKISKNADVKKKISKGDILMLYLPDCTRVVETPQPRQAYRCSKISYLNKNYIDNR